MADLEKARNLAALVRFNEDRASDDIAESFEFTDHRDAMLRHGLLISEALTPVLEERLAEVCDRLFIPRESVSAFVHNSADVQADCLIDSPSTCVLRFTSGLVNLMDAKEFQFVAAHELGHFLLNHGACNQYKEKGSAQEFMTQRARELSADRVGFLGVDNLDESIQAIIKTASGLGDEFLRFDVASFVSQGDMLSKPERGESSNSTHPSMLMRCRALLWFSMQVQGQKELCDIQRDVVDKIDRRVQVDLERFVDGHVRLRNKELEEDVVLWKSCELTIHAGAFSKDIQNRMSEQLGQSNVDSLKSFFGMFSSDDLLNEVSSRLTNAINSLHEAFPDTAQEQEDRAFAKAYGIVEGRDVTQ